MKLKFFFVLCLMLPLLCKTVAPVINKEKVTQWASSIHDLEGDDLTLLKDLLQKYNYFSDKCLTDIRFLVSYEGKKQVKEFIKILKSIKNKSLLRNRLGTFVELFKSEVRHETLGEKKTVALQQEETNYFVFFVMKKLSGLCLKHIISHLDKQKEEQVNYENSL